MYYPKGCVKIYYELVSANVTYESASSAFEYCREVEKQNKYSKPMVWIGIYIALASILCIIAMGADLLHGLRKKKLWFPSKYFTLNAASITIITVTMKLPVDLNTYMPDYLDQATKLGSMAFMCTMMANFMPSLASMDNNTLLANVIGLVILVITIVVNICIEISTGVIDNDKEIGFPNSKNYYISSSTFAYIYVSMLLWLLIIMISSAIAIPSFKRILEIKYQAKGKRTLDSQDNLTSSMVEKLRQYVRRYWVMAESGSPQFVMASNTLSSTSGIICVLCLVLELPIIVKYIEDWSFIYAPGSDYKWSMFFIAIAQSIGVVVGSIAPIFRCFTIINFKLFTNWNKNYFMVFKVEKYWIQKLCDWKESHITFLSRGSWSTTFIRNFRNLFLGLCIGIQKVIIVSSKMMGLIPTVIVILFMYCSYCWKSLVARLFKIPIVVGKDNVNQDLTDCVLQLEDEKELGDRTLNRISNTVNNLIQKAKKEQNKDLLVFLDTSTGFKGVEKFDSDQVEDISCIKLANIWSLPVVTLTCIAISLPNIPKKNVDRLLKNVRAGLSYTHQVEEIINNTNEYGNIQKAGMTLWHEVEEKCMWLNNTMEESAFRGKTPVEIL
ncbi:uncharacterized protein [Rutidosis leptorrhynchoides]|uniref:uncharacterized protein n=1 Tax=Rutidosis leptorrhynchoides TaxID=125765 RepID=UPI003A9A18E9